MIESIKTWWEMHQRRKYDRRVADGFGWAMGAFFCERLPLYYIKDLHETDIRSIDRTFQAFDTGVAQGILELEEMIKESPRLRLFNKRNGE